MGNSRSRSSSPDSGLGKRSDQRNSMGEETKRDPGMNQQNVESNYSQEPDPEDVETGNQRRAESKLELDFGNQIKADEVFIRGKWVGTTPEEKSVLRFIMSYADRVPRRGIRFLVSYRLNRTLFLLTGDVADRIEGYRGSAVWFKLAAWTMLCELWPLRTSWLLACYEKLNEDRIKLCMEDTLLNFYQLLTVHLNSTTSSSEEILKYSASDGFRGFSWLNKVLRSSRLGGMAKWMSLENGGERFASVLSGGGAEGGEFFTFKEEEHLLTVKDLGCLADYNVGLKSLTSNLNPGCSRVMKEALQDCTKTTKRETGELLLQFDCLFAERKETSVRSNAREQVPKTTGRNWAEIDPFAGHVSRFKTEQGRHRSRSLSDMQKVVSEVQDGELPPPSESFVGTQNATQERSERTVESGTSRIKVSNRSLTSLKVAGDDASLTSHLSERTLEDQGSERSYESHKHFHDAVQGKDVLDYDIYVKALTQTLLEASPGLRIALFDPWGQGKSFIIQRIRSYLIARAIMLNRIREEYIRSTKRKELDKGSPLPLDYEYMLQKLLASGAEGDTPKELQNARQRILQEQMTLRQKLNANSAIAPAQADYGNGRIGAVGWFPDKGDENSYCAYQWLWEAPIFLFSIIMLLYVSIAAACEEVGAWCRIKLKTKGRPGSASVQTDSKHVKANIISASLEQSDPLHEDDFKGLRQESGARNTKRKGRRPRKEDRDNRRLNTFYEYLPVVFNAWEFQNSESIETALLYVVTQHVEARFGDRYTRAYEIATLWVVYSVISLLLIFVVVPLAVVDLGKMPKPDANTVTVITAIVGAVIAVTGALVTVMRFIYPSLPLSRELMKQNDSKRMSNRLGYAMHVKKSLNSLARMLEEPATIKTVWDHFVPSCWLFRQKVLEKLKEAHYATWNPMRIVLFIDDLDRCESKVALDIFKSAVSSMDDNDGSFIVCFAMDPDQIAEAVESASEYEFSGSGYSYLEKVVHLPFSIPALNKKSMGALVNKYVDVGQSFSHLDFLQSAKREDFEDWDDDETLQVANFAESLTPAAKDALVSALADFIQVNKNVKHIRMWGNGLQIGHARKIASAINARQNSNLGLLHINGNTGLMPDRGNILELELHFSRMELFDMCFLCFALKYKLSQSPEVKTVKLRLTKPSGVRSLTLVRSESNGSSKWSSNQSVRFQKKLDVLVYFLLALELKIDVCLSAESTIPPCSADIWQAAVEMISGDNALDLHEGLQLAEILARATRFNATPRTIWLDGSLLDEFGAKKLAEALKQNTSLRNLRLWSMTLGDGAAVALGKSLAQNVHLKELSLAHNEISSAGAKRLVQGLASNRRTGLAKLRLWGNDIGDEGTKALAACLAENTSLKEIELRRSRVGVIGASALADALTRNKSLKELSLWDNDLRASGTRQLAPFLSANSSLTKLDIRNNSLDDGGTEALAAGLSTNDTLTELSLWENHVGNRGAIALAKAIENNEAIRLRKLDLWNNIIGPDGAKALALKVLAQNTTLRQLSLWDNWIGSEGAEAVARGIATNKSLKELNLGSNGIDHHGGRELAMGLSQNSSLKMLYLWSNRIGDDGARALGPALVANTVLTELNLWENHIGDAGATALGEGLAKNASLTELNLGGNKITSKGAVALSVSLGKNDTLTVLYLSGNDIHNAGAKAFATLLSKNTTLNKLYLSENSIEDEGARAFLEVLPANKSLKEIDVRWNDISDGMWRRLRECDGRFA